jgi:hypothetical protein
MLATATAKGDDAQGASGGGSNASATAAVASEAPVTESRQDASVRPASNESDTKASPAGGAAERQAAPATGEAAASGEASAAGGKAREKSDGGAKNADPLAATVDESQLGTSRGGAELEPVPLTINQNNTTGAVSGNVAANLTTGSNNISDSAFSNSAGVPVVIQNTGNNVLIQNSTILNLQLTSPK